MATPNGTQTDPLKEREDLLPGPSDDFLEAVRRLQRAFPRAPAVGAARRLREEHLRFRSEPRLAFAPGTIAGSELDEVRRLIVVTVRFMGLLGPNAPMPLVLAEHALDRRRHADDPTLVRFLDLFHHRLISLFFRAWALNNQAVDFESREEFRFGRFVGAFAGIGLESSRHRDSISDGAKLYFAGRLAAGPKSADGLEALLAEFLEVPVRVLCFQGHWLDLPEENRLRLGSPSTGELGRTTIVGAKVWDAQLKFRLRVGPVNGDELEAFIPVGKAFAQIRDWVRLYTGGSLLWDLQITVRRETVPPIQLGRSGRLGWSTWLGSDRSPGVLDNLVIHPPAA
ncbi:MAG: type VI secretion system baseplate subunit TssG [Puniceicoccaceae bacterium]|nr:MAG: type VI secretion system baseplate subunit TssG [Puniceicoccaceae bacterium]